MKYYQIRIINHYTLEYREIIRRTKIEIDFREPYIELERDMIKSWEPPFKSIKLNDLDKDRIYNRVKVYLINKFQSKSFYFED